MIVMKLAFYLRKKDAMSILHSALLIQAPQTGQHEPVLNEEQFNADVARLLCERNIMPVLRVVPETKWSSKEKRPLNPVPGFRGFIEDLKTKVIKYDPRAKSSELDFYDPDWLERMQEDATKGVNAAMELIPDDLQQHMILTFEVRDVLSGDRENDVLSMKTSQNVYVHIDRSKVKTKTSGKPDQETFHIEGTTSQLFSDLWVRIWLQDYTHHAATGRMKSLATKGWMPMQLRGLRESFAQILTDTKQILFNAYKDPRDPLRDSLRDSSGSLQSPHADTGCARTDAGYKRTDTNESFQSCHSDIDELTLALLQQCQVQPHRGCSQM